MEVRFGWLVLGISCRSFLSRFAGFPPGFNFFCSFIKKNYQRLYRVVSRCHFSTELGTAPNSVEKWRGTTLTPYKNEDHDINSIRTTSRYKLDPNWGLHKILLTQNPVLIILPAKPKRTQCSDYLLHKIKLWSLTSQASCVTSCTVRYPWATKAGPYSSSRSNRSHSSNDPWKF